MGGRGGVGWGGKSLGTWFPGSQLSATLEGTYNIEHTYNTQFVVIYAFVSAKS